MFFCTENDFTYPYIFALLLFAGYPLITIQISDSILDIEKSAKYSEYQIFTEYLLHP